LFLRVSSTRFQASQQVIDTEDLSAVEENAQPRFLESLLLLRQNALLQDCFETQLTFLDVVLQFVKDVREEHTFIATDIYFLLKLVHRRKGLVALRLDILLLQVEAALLLLKQLALRVQPLLQSHLL